MDINDRFRGCLLGLAVGDAVGTTLEFKPPGSFIPISGMTGGGPFNLKSGEWTDGTSMALCLATSLVETGRFDPKDQMDRYWRWWKEGYLSSNGHCFDIGNTVAAALRRYQTTGDPMAGSTSPHSAGNGSIMRLAPVPMFYYPDLSAASRYSAESSRTTHGAAECIDACRLLAGMICRALSGGSKEEVLLGEAGSFQGEPKIAAIARGEYEKKSINQIRGSGYVVESLEAALWCFLHTDSFDAAVLNAANLGDDADTTAAICGQAAGAFYGECGIPKRWLNKLVMRQEISTLADRLFEADR
ncbi:MAG: ADP-ribosylglycohydrolase family protein [Chloroflexota bacterium]